MSSDIHLTSEMNCEKQLVNELLRASSPAMKPQTQRRHLGIDLLRIVAMFMVCVLHVNNTSHALKYVLTEPLEVRMGVWGSEVFCLMAVNLYAMVTGYVCVTGAWKPSRYLRLWMQVAFYTVGFFLLRELLGMCGVMEAAPLSWKRWVRAFLPIPFASVYWYFTAYTALFLLIPFINKLMYALSAEALRCLLFVFFGVFCCSVVVAGDSVFAAGCNAVWLLLLYVGGAYVKLYPLKVPGRWLFLGVVAGMVVAMSVTMLREKVYTSYVFPPTVLLTLCTFLYFEKLQINSSRVARLISIFAPLSFGVYLVHVHPCTWTAMHQYMPPLFEHFDYAWWLFMLSPVVLYFACSLVDACRLVIFNLCRSNIVADILERWLKKLWNQALRMLQKWVGAWFT